MNKRIMIFLLFGVLLVGCSERNEVMTAQEGTTIMAESTSDADITTVDSTKEKSFIYVYVCGYVEEPGVYPLPIGARVCDALELAGGVTKDGKPEALAQAEYVTDGQTIYVPSIYEESDLSNDEDGRVDINEADSSMLMTLPGIGESKAEIILQYREEHGAFETIEDLMDIPGIKEGVFNKIKDYIKV